MTQENKPERRFDVGENLLQAISHYITKTPSPTMPVEVAVNILGAMQQLKEVGAKDTSGLGLPPTANAKPNGKNKATSPPS